MTGEGAAMTLRERIGGLVAKLKPLMENATPRQWSTNSRYKPQASAKVLVGSDMRTVAYVGMNPGVKEWETYAQDITNAQLIVAAVNAVDELAAALAVEEQVEVTGPASMLDEGAPTNAAY